MKRNLIPAYDLIKSFEGLYLKPYLDPVKIPTIGWGSIRYPNGKRVTMNDPAISKDQAQQYLEYEVSGFIASVEKAIKVNLNDNQFCALVSFCYNVGAGAFASSTLVKKINANDLYGASKEFGRWNKAGGKELKGLTSRRESEKNLFLAPITLSHADIPVSPAPTDYIIDDKKSWTDSVLDFLGTSKTPTTTGKPDDAETGAPVKATLSDGDGPRITKERVEEILLANGCDITKFCKLGIRGYYLDTYGVKGANDRGVYDDAIIQYWGDGFYTFRGNVDASAYRKGKGFWAEKGMAMLKKGVWLYQKGIHKTYWAFVQAAVVTALRDMIGGGSYADTGWFGINIHRGGAKGTSSLGCQTYMADQWEKAKAMAYAKLDEKSQKTFQYCLVEELDLRANILKAV